jgi:hypothetical protein
LALTAPPDPRFAFPREGWLTRRAEAPAVIVAAVAFAVLALAPGPVFAGPGTPEVERPADRQPMQVAGSVFDVAFDGTAYQAGAGEVLQWIRRSASIVAGYYGVFPVPKLEIVVTAVDGDHVRGGKTFADPMPRILVSVGRATSSGNLVDDWVLVHEMTHLALPDVGRAHHWLEEGIATYVEGIERVQAGNMKAPDLWQEYVTSMPKGLPAEGDRGLDQTHTWGRTYWGGALFCLAADVSIRERSANRFGLQDALREVLRQSGGMTADWPIERVFQVGDKATGTTVLSDLYRAMRDAPSAPDLPDLWSRLGVHAENGSVRLETGTPQSQIRDRITLQSSR